MMDLLIIPNLLQVTQWGTIAWTSLGFSGCTNLTITAPDVANVSNIGNMGGMFYGCSSITTIPNMNQWDVSNVSDMGDMFAHATSFNQAIGDWNTSKVTNMSEMFEEATSFNQPIGNWNTSKVKYMGWMFDSAVSFNQPLNNWNTSNVVEMQGIFTYATSFNQPLDNWNTGNVLFMSEMFAYAASFNQPLNNWNTGKVRTTEAMFSYATSFNQPLNDWNTSTVRYMDYMFYGAVSFDQSLGNWNLSSILPTDEYNDGYYSFVSMFDNSGLSCANYSNTLIGWAGNLGNTTPSNLTLGAEGLQYNAAASAARTDLVNAGWTITSDNGGCVVPAAPITLQNFTAQIQNNTALLQWTTVTESNDKGFSVQRSPDGITWQDIAFVASQANNGNSSIPLHYQYIDASPLSGYNYYRLKQEDLDGTVNYSGVQEVMLGIGVQLYPNPAASTLYVQLSSATNNTTYKLVNVSGSIVQKGNLQNGKNTLSVSNLAGGVYFLQVIINGVQHSYEVEIAR